MQWVFGLLTSVKRVSNLFTSINQQHVRLFLLYGNNHILIIFYENHPKMVLKKILAIFKMVAFILTDSALAYPINCDNYFSPCTCESNYYDTMGNYGYMVKCANMSTANIQKVLTKPTSKIDNQITTLYLAPNDTNLVAKITGSRTFFALILDCSSAPNNMLLFNLDAFSSTKIDTYALTIQNCNLIKFSWSFLTNFTYLYSISISNSSNIHTTFSTLPVKTLPWLKRLELNRIKGINGF